MRGIPTRVGKSVAGLCLPPAAVLDMPLDALFVLTAALSANEGAECAGEDYRERDSAAAPGREVVAGDIRGATEGEDVADPEAERDEQAQPATEQQGQGQHEHNQQKAENSHVGNL